MIRTGAAFIFILNARKSPINARGVRSKKLKKAIDNMMDCSLKK